MPLRDLLELSVDLNSGPERRGFVTTALGVLTVVQRAGNCVVAIAPTSQAFDENGGAGTIGVTAAPGCGWDATAHDFFPDQVAPLVAHGIGNGVVPFTIAVNKSSLYANAPFFLVGGSLKFQITQSACPMTVSPLSFHVPAAAADYVVSVRVAGSVICDWVASSSDPSIISFVASPLIGGGVMGSGSRDLPFSVSQNQTGQTRIGRAIVATHTVVVTQDP